MSKVTRRRVLLPPEAFSSTERVLEGECSQKADDDLAAKEMFGVDEQKICAAESEGLVIHEH